MITFFYIGESRFRNFTVTNHDKMFNVIRSNWPIQVVDYTHTMWDRSHCPFDRSGAIQVWDYYQVLKNIETDIVIKLRTDIWFDDSCHQAILSELGKIVDGEQDVSFLGAEMYNSFDAVYERIPVPNVFKVQDYMIMADRRRLRSEEAVMDDLTNGKPFKSGNKTWQFIIDNPERAYTVRCQMFLVRKAHPNLTTWQVGYDFIEDLGKCDQALAWWELNRPID